MVLSGRKTKSLSTIPTLTGRAMSGWMDASPLQAHLFNMDNLPLGETIVIVSTNYTFDPDGMDDHLHMASSVLKRSLNVII